MCGIWAVFGSEEGVAAQCQACHSITHRGPDSFRMENVANLTNCMLGFHRLAIVDSEGGRGMQPLNLRARPRTWLTYNGEIYNHKLLSSEFSLKPETELDGEPMIHLYHALGAEAMAQQLDGVFAFCLLDMTARRVVLGRDTYGVRPLFRLHTESGFLAVCSEAKGLQGLGGGAACGVGVEPFPPGHVEVYQLDDQGHASLVERSCFHKAGDAPLYRSLVMPQGTGDVEDIQGDVWRLLEAAVDKRLMAHRRIGCLLSGGLDSSLVAALLVRLAKQRGLDYPLQTFAIGMQGSPDLKAARKVAAHLGTEHHEVLMTPEEGLEALAAVVRHLETYDTTTVRASVGMYLLSKYIKEKTDTTVILSGEGSDEVAQGYIYFHKAPSAAAGDAESRRLLRDLYMYDVLRGDRTTAAWGLEVRVPFLDHRFSSYYLSLDADLRQPKNGIEKHLLRSAFDREDLLPVDVLWRPKEAFSDGISSVQRSWFTILQEHCEEQINDQELAAAATLYPHNPPATKEQLYYRRLFEQNFPGQAGWIPYFWMPRWSDATDPSARVLKHYKQ